MSKITFPSKALFICNGSKCGKHKEIRKYIKKSNKEKEQDQKIEVFKMECSDRCKSAPIGYYQPDNLWLEKVDLDTCKKLLEK
jgi:NADH:ubiquinone oxidoreductase subunit E